MGSHFTVTGVLDTKDAARAFRALLAGSGIAHERIRLILNAADTGEAGSRDHGRRVRGADHGQRGAQAVRRSGCLVSVDVRSLRDRMRVEALMAAAGAR